MGWGSCEGAVAHVASASSFPFEWNEMCPELGAFGMCQDSSEDSLGSEAPGAKAGTWLLLIVRPHLSISSRCRVLSFIDPTPRTQVLLVRVPCGHVPRPSPATC